MMIDQSVEILRNKNVSENTFLLAFKSKEMAAEAKPGQFVMVQVSEGLEPLLRRPFSICAVEEEGVVILLYKRVGRGTELLSAVGPGRRMRVLGPLGKGFRLPDSLVFPILVSGGIGAAPMVFLAHSLGSRSFLWLAGYRTAAEIPPFPELGVPPDKISVATEDGSAGEKCLVTELLERSLDSARERPCVFSCGPSAMLKVVAARTETCHIPAQVSIESVMACGIGACQGCTVLSSSADRAYRRVCLDGPVFDSVDIDWSRL
jgi:dihydroorotate dehydrogenase electron transfer subunit